MQANTLSLIIVDIVNDISYMFFSPNLHASSSIKRRTLQTLLAYESLGQIGKGNMMTKKTITRMELAERYAIPVTDTERLYRKIHSLEEEGRIEPVKNSGKNGNAVYPLYNKYRIIETEVEYPEMDKLHPLLLKTGYLRKNPEKYQTYKKELGILSRWLFEEKKTGTMSRKERSFEIFGKEKMLDDSSFKKLLGRLAVTANTLDFYDTPEYCFHDFFLARKDGMHLLVCENKDIWFDIRQIMHTNRTGFVLGQPFDGVIYGEGNKAANKGALTEYLKYTGIEDAHISYWGDIDRAGLDIFLRVAACNPDLSIRLFHEGYRQMLRLSDGRVPEDSKDQRTHDFAAYEAVYHEFGPEEGRKMRAVIEKGQLIPQEIVNMQVLKCFGQT